MAACKGIITSVVVQPFCRQLSAGGGVGWNVERSGGEGKGAVQWLVEYSVHAV